MAELWLVVGCDSGFFMLIMKYYIDVFNKWTFDISKVFVENTGL